LIKRTGKIIPPIIEITRFLKEFANKSFSNCIDFLSNYLIGISTSIETFSFVKVMDQKVLNLIIKEIIK
jgi:hypothetical protein